MKTWPIDPLDLGNVLILIFSMNTNCESMAYRSFGYRNLRLIQTVKAWPIDPLVLGNFKLEVQKSYHRDNWLVAAKRS